ncbi:hypothetical protein A3A39_02585 [Candidatus Kaiserbacteria bacterium RIFCSPLOWO2_01_FULL_54_13]|uniref:Uncharacterized protein n=1 Tax=Candidatus Kaiserbacteria bacterium RIFCSPLOWO2_01_FULL_54_13 TaxID=1798512 RepID=A0A1F6F3H3_9BACT|nr:MAG: hypothetical protein A3A39_02585 [Candidatus Kaiserbacteria bacterium RIFCSPLOWO2_01_FULL_54_13]
MPREKGMRPVALDRPPLVSGSLKLLLDRPRKQFPFMAKQKPVWQNEQTIRESLDHAYRHSDSALSDAFHDGIGREDTIPIRLKRESIWARGNIRFDGYEPNSSFFCRHVAPRSLQPAKQQSTAHKRVKRRCGLTVDIKKGGRAAPDSRKIA